MPRAKHERRFVPRYPYVSKEVIEEEARFVRREVEDLLLASTNDLRALVDERHKLAVEGWAALQKRVASLPVRDADAIRGVLFRDIYHAIACCTSFCGSHQPDTTVRIVPNPVAVERHEQFSEWLFQ